MTKIHSVEADTDPCGNYRVTVRGPRRKVLLRELFVDAKIGRPFFNYCEKRMKEQGE